MGFNSGKTYVTESIEDMDKSEYLDICNLYYDLGTKLIIISFKNYLGGRLLYRKV